MHGAYLRGMQVHLCGSRQEEPAKWLAHNASIVDTVLKLRFNLIVRVIPRVHHRRLFVARPPFVILHLTLLYFPRSLRLSRTARLRPFKESSLETRGDARLGIGIKRMRTM